MRSMLPLAHRPLRSSLAPWLFLAFFLTGCAAPVQIRPAADPPPADLAAPCAAGPAYPTGASAPLAEVLDVVEAREIAAADCRARHAGLVKAWPH